jgi:nucleolar protein 56
MARSLVTTWYGAFVVDGRDVVRSAPVPRTPAALAERIRLRREGRLTPEEAELLNDPDRGTWTTRDRRVAEHGVRWEVSAPALPPGDPAAADVEPFRAALLTDAVRAVADAWDPSIHVEEAVRAAADLDRIGNLLGERLGSWVARDSPEIDPGDHGRAARRAIDGGGDPGLAPNDPALATARRQLAELYLALRSVRDGLADGVASSAPRRTPNLVALLGPELASRLVAQAGGLDRLARLPASTVQVLGAETAFFEHLRGRAPPPRHGLLFLHPAIQGASRRERGKLARSLAGKAAIAARLDRAGAPIEPALAAGFEARRARVRAEATPGKRRRDRPGSGKPLDRATGDR